MAGRLREARERDGEKSGLSAGDARFRVLVFLRWLGEMQRVTTADRLRRECLEAWVHHLAPRRTTKGLPLKPASVNKQIESVRGWVRWLGGRGVVPAGLVESLDYVLEPRLLPTSVLPHAQVKKLVGRIDTSNAEGIRDRAMVELMYSSGIRAAELLGLDVGDLDLDNATALVMGKGRKQRVVPIGKTALKVVTSYLRGVRPFLSRGGERTRLVADPDRPAGAVCPHPAQTPAPARRSTRAARITVTPHTLRPSCTTELIRGGANLWHIKELLGHEHLDTLQHYAKLSIADLKKTHAKGHPREREG